MNFLDRTTNLCQYVNTYSYIMNTALFFIALGFVWVLQSFLLGARKAGQEELERLVEQQKAISKLYPNGNPFPY